MLKFNCIKGMSRKVFVFKKYPKMFPNYYEDTPEYMKWYEALKPAPHVPKVYRFWLPVGKMFRPRFVFLFGGKV